MTSQRWFDGFLGVMDESSLDTRNLVTSCLPIRWMSDHNQTLDATYAANGNSSSEYTIVSVYEMGKCICSPLFLYHQKDGTPFVLYSPTTNGEHSNTCQETENADLKSGYARYYQTTKIGTRLGS